MSRRKPLLALLSVILILALTGGLMIAGCGGKDEPAEPPDESTTDATGSAQVAGRLLVVLPSNDFNDTEYSTTTTMLYDAGFETQVANTSGQESIGMEGTKVSPDLTVGEADPAEYAAVIFIGGNGAAEYFDNAQVLELARNAASEGKVVAAICIAPVILANAGLLEGKQGTVSVGEKDSIIAGGCEYQEVPCVVEGQLITASGPEASREFAENIIMALEQK